MTIHCFLFILLILSFSLLLSTNDSEINKIDYFSLCKKYGYKCGNQSYDIPHPSRLDKSPHHCGYSEFELSCTSVYKPLTYIGGKEYKVKHINCTHHLLSVTDISFVDHDESRLCDSIFTTTNTSINLTPFSYSINDGNLTVLIDCSSDLSLPYPNFGNIKCLGRDSHSKAYYNLSSEVQDDIRKKCKHVAIVPTYQTFDLSWKLNDKFCKCVDSNGTCYTDEMGSLACHCSDGTVSSDGSCVINKKKNNSGAVIGAVAGVGGLFLLGTCFVILLFVRRKRKLKANSSNLLSQTTSSILSSKMDHEAGETNYNTHIFTYDELEVATHGFHESRELGDGGFGAVYKGKLQDGRMVAVKRLYKNNYRRLDQFLNEVEILSRLRHQNLVTLYGCTSRHRCELLLVYEYISNGTLADHLHGPLSSKPTLPWPTRLSIIIQTAEALSYLHSVEPQIIHRDIKTTNILVDHDFHVKVADFGLSRLFPLNATHVSTAPQGTPGYVDPEYRICFQLTDKSDVYSFGVVLVEIISSKPAVDISRHRHEINLANMAISKIQNCRINELVDPDLGYGTDAVVRRRIDQVAELAFRCLQADGEMRPGIKEVLCVLRCIKGEVEGEGIDSPGKEESKLLKSGTPFVPDSVVSGRWSSRSNTSKNSG